MYNYISIYIYVHIYMFIFVGSTPILVRWPPHLISDPGAFSNGRSPWSLAWLAPHFWEDWKLEINVEHHFPFPLTSWHFGIFLGLEPQNELGAWCHHAEEACRSWARCGWQEEQEGQEVARKLGSQLGRLQWAMTKMIRKDPKALLLERFYTTVLAWLGLSLWSD